MSVFIMSLASTTGAFAQNSNTVTTCYAGNLCSTHLANNTDNVNIVDIHTQPSSIKVGDVFKITATLKNSSPDSISVVIDDCEGPFAVTFDNHVMIQNNNFTCAYSLFHQTLNSNETTSKTSPGTTLVYKAVSAGTTNATITFSYYTKNQTDHTQPEIRKTISKSFLFDVHDNKTNAIPPSINPSYPIHCCAGPVVTSNMNSPLKQFKSGISALDVKCPSNYALVIKAEDGSPACVRPFTVNILSVEGWSKFESTQSNHNANAKTNPFGIVGLMYYYGGGPCGVGTCPLNTFNLKMNSNYTTYLLGYNICDDNSCIVRNDLSILLPLNVIGMPNYKFIALPENPQWKHEDIFHIQVEVSSIPDNKTAIWTDLGNSTIIH